MSHDPDRRLLLQAAAFSGALAAAGAAQAAGAGDPLVVVAEIVSKPGSEDALRPIVTALAAASRREAGCRHYALLEDRQTAGRFFTYEVWDDEAALAGHMKGAAIAQAAKGADLIAKPPTQAMLRTLST